MSEIIDGLRFGVLLRERFPEVAETLDPEIKGSLYMEMGAFARATQRAISDEDKTEVKRHFDFMNEIYRLANDDVSNAVGVSYLEQISFDGKHAQRINARQMLSPQLQESLSSLEEYLRRLFGKPRLH